MFNISLPTHMNTCKIKLFCSWWWLLQRIIKEIAFNILFWSTYSLSPPTLHYSDTILNIVTNDHFSFNFNSLKNFRYISWKFSLKLSVLFQIAMNLLIYFWCRMNEKKCVWFVRFIYLELYCHFARSLLFIIFSLYIFIK